MADMNQAFDALRQAHAAGDTESARRLSEWIQSQQQAAPEPTLRQKIIASPVGRVLQGARDPIDAAAQLAPRGLEFLTSYGGFYKNPVSEFFGSEAQRVDKGIAEAERELSQARTATGQSGIDAYRLAGNVISPANLAMAARLPVTAATTGGRFMQGAALGGAGGLLQPVNVEENPDFAATKRGQVLLGTVTGGVATPAIGAITDRVGRFLSSKLNKMRGDDVVTLKQSAQDFAEASGLNWNAMTQDQKIELQNQVTQAAKEYAGKDPRAAMRIADFKALDMPYTLGQVTRDPAQFAIEKNLTQLDVGTPLRERFMQQGAQIQKGIGSFATGAQEQQIGGNQLVNALKDADKQFSNEVGAAYGAARKAAGKDVEIPMQGLAQDFANVIDQFSQNTIDNLPIKEFQKYGLLSGKQTKLFTVEEADKLIKVINANQSNDPATNAALSALRGAVKKAVREDAGVNDVFEPARQLAARRFQLQDAIPALEASANGTANPDTFVQNFILSKTAQSSQVKKMAELLRNENPEAFAEARLQLGAHLQRRAFGENIAGDKPFSPERYQSALRELGTEKLSAFFTPKEIENLRRFARVGSYMESIPYTSKPNVSGNWGAITNLLTNTPGVPQTAALINVLRSGVANQVNVDKALRAQPARQLTPEEIKYISRFLSGTATAAGAVGAMPLQ